MVLQWFHLEVERVAAPLSTRSLSGAIACILLSLGHDPKIGRYVCVVQSVLRSGSPDSGVRDVMFAGPLGIFWYLALRSMEEVARGDRDR